MAYKPPQEIFIRYLTEQAHNVVKAERKPRRNIQYKDFGWCYLAFSYFHGTNH
jgi:hypothetical protein